MKVLVLLSSVVLLCSAAPALEEVECKPDILSRLAVQHINSHHDHGYKFRLNRTISAAAAGDIRQCTATVKVELLETKCHVVDPKHFKDCEIREDFDREVMATCNVEMTLSDNEAKIWKHECSTRQVKTDVEMSTICPDCSKLIPLHSPTSVKIVDETVKDVNKNISNQHYYILHEVGRMKSGYMMMTGMFYYGEIVLVETHCPMGSRIVPEACIPLCPERAHHALCQTTYSDTAGLMSVDCEYYPPLNTTALSPGETEPVCRHSQRPHLCPPPHAGPHGPPPHAGPHGPPPHAGGHGRGHGLPPHAGGHGPPPHGPPPHAGGHGRGHGPPPHGPPPFAGGHGPPPHGPPPFAGGHGPPPHAGGHAQSIGPPPGQEKLHLCPPCNLNPTSFDPALHPICPWP
ncbi:hypothetical protein PAMA_001888 [Pampus argenteus]